MLFAEFYAKIGNILFRLLMILRKPERLKSKQAKSVMRVCVVSTKRNSRCAEKSITITRKRNDYSRVLSAVWRRFWRSENTSAKMNTSAVQISRSISEVLYVWHYCCSHTHGAGLHCRVKDKLLGVILWGIKPSERVRLSVGDVSVYGVWFFWTVMILQYDISVFISYNSPDRYAATFKWSPCFFKRTLPCFR